MVRDATADEIFIVVADRQVREAVSEVLRQDGYRVSGFADADSFLAAERMRTPACIVLGANALVRAGSDFPEKFDVQNFQAPVVIVSGKADTAVAAIAIRNGAQGVIAEPFTVDTVVTPVRTAIARGRSKFSLPVDSFPGYSLLTPRERDVLEQIAAGASNKEAGRRLGISSRTIEVHRARIMEKLGARNAADLVRIVMSGRRS